jgi:hypothetical protein
MFYLAYLDLHHVRVLMINYFNNVTKYLFLSNFTVNSRANDGDGDTSMITRVFFQPSANIREQIIQLGAILVIVDRSAAFPEVLAILVAAILQDISWFEENLTRDHFANSNKKPDTIPGGCIHQHS